MTELDFDELDQAVNKLMEGVDTTKRNPALDDPAEKVVTLDSAVPAATPAAAAPVAPAPTPTASTPTPAATVAAPAAPTPEVTVPAVKRRGQFMDVIHPSTDMKKVPIAAPVSRQGVSLQPSAEAVAAVHTQAQDTVAETPAPTAEAFSFDQEQTAGSAPEAVAPAAPEVTPVSEANPWPDPIDALAAPATTDPGETPSVSPVAPAAVEPEPTSTEPAVVESEAPAPELASTPSDDDTPAMTSPFLPDAKPEKRPLGSLQPDETEASDTTPPAEAAEVQDVSDEAPEAANEIITVPEELKQDVMAIEANPVETPSNTPTVKIETDAPPQMPADPAPVPQTDTTTTGSIPQQYTEAPSSGDQTNGSIYDTATYHQAPEPAKQKSSFHLMKYVVGVIVLVIIGAAIGAVYFYYTRG